MSQSKTSTIVPADKLRWRCPLDQLKFESTAQIPPSKEIHGQQTAWEALKFGIVCSAPGQNVYVRGQSGTGRKSMIRQLLEDYQPENVTKYDRCYVHNFSRPERPRLISLPPGTGCEFRNQVREFGRYVKEELNEALNADYLLARRTAIQTSAQEEVQQLKEPLEADLKAAGMALVSIQAGQMIQTQGEVVGQINGLAVIHSGPITYGFPARITATIAPGRAGLINIEGSANMSGSIHTKGFSILGGLLRYLLKPIHPMSFSASLAFEQSYGGIDGDSASGAETVCLLSALTDIPIKQSIAMTGAIDQHGHVEAIGGVNEKIEGFFDACNYFGLTGDQSVIIPESNAADLMLRRDVVEACEAGKFAIHAVLTIHQALEIATGVPAGEIVDGLYPEGSLLNIAQQKTFEYWDQTLSHPDKLLVDTDDDETSEEA